MKFKLFSAVLLLICFVLLGVISGAIPVTEMTGDTAAGLFSVFAARTTEPPAAATASILPTARSAPAATPELPTMPTPGPTPRPEATPGGVAAAASASPAATKTPGPAASPTPGPAPTAAPEATDPPATPADAPTELWEPDVAVISTTITWNDPLQNETSYPVDGAELLDRPLNISLPEEGPQVLIIHTHGTEAYTPDGEDQYEASGDYRTTDKDHNIIRVGQALGQALRSYGLDVLVDTGIYDWPNYDDAYGQCAEAIKTYLAESPGIRVVIDLHRDALGDDEVIYRTISDEIQPDAAQLMFVVGTDEKLAHPNWRENLRFAMCLQGLMEEQYPHIMRPTLLATSRYNQQLTPASVLLEIGTSGNTLREAIASAELFAQVAGPALAARIGV